MRAVKKSLLAITKKYATAVERISKCVKNGRYTERQTDDGRKDRGKSQCPLSVVERHSQLLPFLQVLESSV